MKIISHRFLNYPIDPAVEMLIIGTFNPDTEKNPAAIFYGRRRNFLWRLLPLALGTPDLKNEQAEEKFKFIREYHIGFIDLVAEVKVDIGSETNYEDRYIDSRVSRWRDVLGVVKQLNNLKKVCFTRKSFSDIPRVREKIREIAAYCTENSIAFQYLSTPSRIYSREKQDEWTRFFRPDLLP